MALVWSGHDAFDAMGTRVASVVRFRDVIGGEGTFALTKQYWNAFVAHEYVLVDGCLGAGLRRARRRRPRRSPTADT
jgi:hypothetical protein